MRYLMLSLPFVLGLFFIADRVFVRTITAEKSVMAVSLSKEDIYAIALEDQEIVNTESINVFAKNAMSFIFNFAPGQAKEHIDSETIKALFVSENFHNAFSKQFIAWANYEFQVNNISIKESFVKEQQLYQSPSMNGGARIWRFEARLPVLDRAVGGTSLKTLNVEVNLVYLGHQGGLGIYSIRLR